MDLKEEITELIYKNSKDISEGVLIDFKDITLLIENIAAISVTRCCKPFVCEIHPNSNSYTSTTGKVCCVKCVMG